MPTKCSMISVFPTRILVIRKAKGQFGNAGKQHFDASVVAVLKQWSRFW